jgi:transcriptional regulator with PAS, ATPase and Fis domain
MRNLAQHLLDQYAVAKLIGESPAFLKAIERVPLIAKTESPVIITGETGTGKELAARAVHYLSPRAPFPFVAVNCGSLTETLLEDELFGHERGAFTNADRARPGLIAEAARGTLFLDEIDSLPPKAQTDLLRVIQDKAFRAVGSSRQQEADVRIVAATNRRLEQLIVAGSFRSDLYYRLSVFSIELPPLRDRVKDIVPLARHFLRKHAPPHRAVELTDEACSRLNSCQWPGNVRELENAIIRGIHYSEGGRIDAEHLGLALENAEISQACAPARSLRTAKKEIVEAFERDYLIRLMSEHQGHVSKAAAAAKKERRDLGKLLKRYGIDPESFRPVTRQHAG